MAPANHQHEHLNSHTHPNAMRRRTSSSIAAFLCYGILIMSQKTISAFAIGEPGKPWGIAEKKEWRDTRIKQRSYFDDVLPRIHALKETRPDLLVETYGHLDHYSDDPELSKESFPLFAVRTREWSPNKPCVLVTGGVHGYETSGVEGAFLFLETEAKNYAKDFNILVCPCVSPWGYERIQRWTAYAVDPNRSFNPDGAIVEGRSFNPEPATHESAALIGFLRTKMSEVMGTNGDEGWICHIDLHETTDTDETEFEPSKAARDGKALNKFEHGEIPDGFYLVQDTPTKEVDDWHKAMIERVRTVTHIAPADDEGKIIGEKVSQEGVIMIPAQARDLGLCAGVTSAPYRTTTEVYPDSANATPEQCNLAQVACIRGGLDYILAQQQQRCEDNKAEQQQCATSTS